jgi:acetylornithine/N-succinyldiaminopimelate aminotransferase
MSRLFWYPGHEVLIPDVVRAEGAAVWDAAGRRYVDLEAGVWCTILGHGHPRVRAALQRQAGELAHTGFCYSSGIVEEAAEEVLSVLGFEGGRCVFLCSGSEAVEYGVRAAAAVADRPYMMTMADSYFGAYGSASRRDASAWVTFDWLRCAGKPGRSGCGPGCGHLEGVPFDAVAGFLFEPGSSSGMVRFPPSDLIEAIAAKVRAGDGLVVVNEVTTGLGRTGEWFGYRHYAIDPDIVALGKGIGNGYPVAVAAFSARALERLGDRPIRWAQSHQNDPLGAAVALEVLRTLGEERLVERGREIAARLHAGLEGVQERTGRIAAVRGRGLMVAVELVDDDAASRTARVFRALLQEGFIVAQRPGLNVLRIDPPLTIEPADVEAFVACLEDVL